MANARLKQQKLRSKYGRYLCLLVLLALCVYSGVWVWYRLQTANLFPIKKVLVVGDLSHVQKEVIVAKVEKNLEGGFFSLNLSPVTSTLLTNPWLTKVAYRRVWPDTLVVSLREHHAIARWGKRGVLTQSGKIFYPDIKTISSDLPLLSGPLDQSKNMLQWFQALNGLLKPLSLSVLGLAVSDSGCWSVVLSNGIDVVMGAKNRLQRFKRLVRVYKKLQAMAPRPVTKVDLRYPNGFAVTYQSPTMS